MSLLAEVTCEDKEMKRKTETGFSLIELLLVVVIIGIIAALAVPALQKGVWAAQNGSTVATLRTLHSTQTVFYSQHSRWGRIDEINSIIGSPLGLIPPNQAARHQYVYEMVPADPTDAELKDGYTLIATRDVASDGVIYQYKVTEDGYIDQLRP